MTGDDYRTFGTVVFTPDWVYVDAAGTRLSWPELGARNAGGSHTLTDVTPYRDLWARTPEGWKMKSREQAGPTRACVDKADFGM